MTLAQFNGATRFLFEERFGAPAREHLAQQAAEEDAAFAASANALRKSR